MSTVLIKNVMSSLLDMSGIKDVNGNSVTLRPKGGPGDSRECPEAVVKDEIVVRVLKAGWIEIQPTAVAAPEPPADDKPPASDKPPKPPKAPADDKPPKPPKTPPTGDSAPAGDQKPGDGGRDIPKPT